VRSAARLRSIVDRPSLPNKRLRIIYRGYNLRKAAANALRRRGKTVPDSLVTVEEIEQVY